MKLLSKKSNFAPVFSHNRMGSSSQRQSMDAKQLQSSTIEFLRFPLAVMVLVIHMTPNVVSLADADFKLLSGHGLYNAFAIMGSHVITHLAVPTFYMISGYLFFVNVNEWSWDVYKTKIRKRISTLFVPYMLWNIIPFVIMITYMVISAYVCGTTMSDVVTYVKDECWRFFYVYKDWTEGVDWLGYEVVNSAPIDGPLWFLRDLIVVTLLTPVIYLVISRGQKIAIWILFLAYVSRVWVNVQGISILAVFFFSLGAYFAINKSSIISFADRYKYFFVPTSVVLMFVTTVYNGDNTVTGQYFYPFYVSSGVFTLWYLASVCVRKYNMKVNATLVSSCFFIYAFHYVTIPRYDTPLSLIKGITIKIMPADNWVSEFICYIVPPVIALSVIIGLFIVCRKLFPKATAIMTGNRK